MNITFLGASGGVTGSLFHLDHNGKTFLVDCGMFQGESSEVDLNVELFVFRPSDLTAVFLTHAHLDHCGRLPMLLHHGFRGKVYMTEASKAIVEVGLLDAAKVSKQHSERGPLYSEDDVYRLLDLVETVNYDTELPVEGLMVFFRDAGHILGSASLEIGFRDNKGENQTIVFSGDLGNSPSDLLKPTEVISRSGFVVMESTYGDELHPEEDINEIIASEINAVEDNGGVLLIPVFSIDRAQSLLHRINHLKRDGKVKNGTSFFLDSPMALAVTRIYERFPELFNEELAAHAKRENPFEFPGLSLIEDAGKSRFIREMTGPKVIIAGSGMMSGGRILHHALEYLPKPTTRLLIVGYQAEDTLGRKLLEGARSVEIDGEIIPVAASIMEVKGMSAHADQKGLISWVTHIQGVKKVFLVHGEERAREVLKTKISDAVKGITVVLPEKGELIAV